MQDQKDHPSNNMKRALIIAGGTGGHVFPALTVARALHKQGIDVHWLGTSKGLEKELVSPEFPLWLIDLSSFQGKKGWRTLLHPWRHLHALWQTYRIIRQIKPHLVLGMGGYVSVPGGLMAWLTRIPLVIHEQNAIAGRANRWLNKIAHVTLEAFPNAFIKRHRVKTTGNPVRPEILQSPLPQDRFLNREGPLRVLILGGSQGARPINEAILSTLKDYSHLNQEILLWHQTGPLDFERVKQAYETSWGKVTVMPFIEDMASAYGWADLVICRAGALTISEIATVGLGSILIPYPHAADNHQWHNGLLLERIGAAIVVDQGRLNKEHLLKLIEPFIQDRSRLLVMAQSARSFAEPQAVEQVVAECMALFTF